MALSQEQEIQRLKAVTAALFAVTKLLCDRHLDVPNVEKAVMAAESALAYHSDLSDQEIHLAKRYLQALLERG